MRCSVRCGAVPDSQGPDLEPCLDGTRHSALLMPSDYAERLINRRALRCPDNKIIPVSDTVQTCIIDTIVQPHHNRVQADRVQTDRLQPDRGQGDKVQTEASLPRR
jgi:hypothetical protein